MKLRDIGLLAACALLAACECETEKAVTTDSGAEGPAAVGGQGTAADFIANAGDRVFYKFDKSDLEPDAVATLDRQAAWLATYPKAITVEGYCDERGTSEYNLGLGKRRAESAANYLVSKGAPAESVKTISYGKDRPIPAAPGMDKEQWWAQNRTAITVVGGGQ